MEETNSSTETERPAADSPERPIGEVHARQLPMEEEGPPEETLDPMNVADLITAVALVGPSLKRLADAAVVFAKAFQEYAKYIKHSVENQDRIQQGPNR